ncbi:flagellar biosynthesis regulator FlaF [Falsiroseomonas oryziterrae]|uniref:flagellar biosynthesis regulator FlaF n=1 Tax=Falsiroseomonas oryziterrae TaxID=2911368 RepID=UPI001F309D3A|nr:flagellar biosynthesis regulator FlaF [Roseomonas sp. NPKOSM-4]
MLARYSIQQNAAASPREVEVRAFRYVNGLLGAAVDVPARVKALHKTHLLWSLLMADLAMPGNALPADLKGRLVSLGLWAQREAMARMEDTASLSPLIELHRDMIAGLEAQLPMPPPPAQQLAFSAGSA